MKFKRKNLLGYFVLFLGLTWIFASLPVVAQDVPTVVGPVVLTDTPDPAATLEPTAAPPVIVVPPSPSPTGSFDLKDIIFAVVVGGLLLLLGYKETSVRALIVQLGASVPVSLLTGGRAAIDTLFQQGQTYVSGTPDSWDDQTLERARKEYQAILDEIQTRRDSGLTGRP